MIKVKCIHEEGFDHTTCVGCGFSVENKPCVKVVDSEDEPSVCYGKLCLLCRQYYYEQKRSKISDCFQSVS